MEKVSQCMNYIQQLVKNKGSDSEDEDIRPKPPTFPKVNLSKLDIPADLLDHILGTIFGNCIGDAIGLITEFLVKPQVASLFGGHKHFEYNMKNITGVKFSHQFRFPTADWTDDSDQMILILQSLIDNSGEVVPSDFGKKIRNWCSHGFPELGDKAGMGCGSTTFSVLHHRDFDADPHLAAYKVWMDRDCNAAPNGGVMRTSILGIHNHQDIKRVMDNTVRMCKTTHADPRCIASTVAVTTCIAMMLQGKHRSSDGSYDAQALTDDAYEYAKPYLNIYQDHKHTDSKKTIPEYSAEELHEHMNAVNIEDLKLDDRGKIGYTYKTLGAGFWAFRQKDFRAAIEAITREAGDADTNGAVAGALLGCKLGYKELPKTWKKELIHKNWLEGHIYKYIELGIMNPAPGTNVDTGASASASPGTNVDTGASASAQNCPAKSEDSKGSEPSPKDETQVGETDANTSQTTTKMDTADDESIPTIRIDNEMKDKESKNEQNKNVQEGN